jgi:penicillin-binding protein 1C
MNAMESAQQKPSRRARWASVWRGLALIAVLALLAGVAIFAWIVRDLPPLSAIEARSVRPTSQFLDRNGRLLYEVIDPNAGKQLSLSLESVPPTCIDATLATEDGRFYSHPGVDVVAIGRAALQNLRADGEIVSGASTITQQVARNLLLDADERYEQSLRRKVREAWLALRLEMRYSKDEILALYLNQTYYGNFAFGLEAAAQIFFAKPAEQLSRGECALLAGLVQYPGGYNPFVDEEAALARRKTVLRLMRDAGTLSSADADALGEEPVRFRTRLFDIEAPHFVVYAQELVERRYGVDRLRQGGLTITTTLDLDLQQRAEEAVRYRLDLLNCRLPGLCTPATNPNRRVDNAAAVVLDSRTGDILAMVGSPDYFDRSIQGNVNAALALRQPGSAIKPLTYAVALDGPHGQALGLEPLTAATILPDLPTTFLVQEPGTVAQEAGAGTPTADLPTQGVPYAPVNYDRAWHGPVSVREALANSYNIPAVLTLERIGVPALKEFAADAGISSFTGDFGLALTLGGGEVRLLELTAAFGALDDGLRLTPRALLDVDDEPLPAPGPAPRILAAETAAIITDILDDDIARIPAFGEDSVLNLPFDAAAKTGTTTDWRDNWTLGYSTERVVGVWVGNADNTPMQGVSGIDGAGPIWRDLMVAVHPVPPAPFVLPASVVDVTVCAPSGLLATPECPRTRLEHFVQGTEPTRSDDQFVRIAVDRRTGLRATDATPADARIERVYWRLPAQYRDWQQGRGIPLPPPTVAQRVDAPLAGGPPGDGTAQVADREGDPLLLTSPAPNSAYRIHPGQPAETQRLQVAGHAGDGVWARLRLVAERPGDPAGRELLAEATDVDALVGWWPLARGEWHFVLEGQRGEASDWERSGASLIVVQ